MKLPNTSNIVAAVAALFCAFLPAPVQAQVGLGLSPMRL